MATAPVITGAPARTPTNIVRLPTAARRKVDNARFAEQRRSAIAARQSGEWPGKYLHPHDRRMDEQAKLLLSIEDTVATRLLQAILAALDDGARQKVAAALAPAVIGERPAALQAFALFKTSKPTVGEAHYLGLALDRLRAEGC
ncbi:hypothetical protein [Sphingomonas sp.]|uniref:hypothetical protein n=1 Tax=Sphingomonas sp. TaxID=28214 RepID=UPI003B002ECB